MALIAHLSSPLLLPRYLHNPYLNPKPNLTLAFRNSRIRAVGGGDMLGDFGARDPFPAEVESRFAEKVLGNVDTEHKILIPSISTLALSQQECAPLSPFQPPMSTDEAQKLLKKVSSQIPICSYLALNTNDIALCSFCIGILFMAYVLLLTLFTHLKQLINLICCVNC